MASQQPLQNLWLTDLIAATDSETFTSNEKLLRQAGARIFPNNVDAYDYESMLCNASGTSERELPQFALVYSHGFHFSTFRRSDLIADHVDGQFKYLYNARMPATNMLAEAVHGQSPDALFCGMHNFDFLNRVPTFPCSLNVAARVHTPEICSGHLGMKLRSSDRLHNRPLWATISGPMAADAIRYTVRTNYGEEQVDVFSMIYNTLQAGSHVIQLGCGEMRFASALLKWLEHDGPANSRCKSLPGIKVSPDMTGSWRKQVQMPPPMPTASASSGDQPDVVMGTPGDTPRSNDAANDAPTADAAAASEKPKWEVKSYREFVIMKPGDPELQGTFGRVNLPRLSKWCTSTSMRYSGLPAPMIKREPRVSAVFDTAWPIQIYPNP